MAMSGRAGRHMGWDQRGGRSYSSGRGAPQYAWDNGATPMSVSPAGAGTMQGRGRAAGSGRRPDQVRERCCNTLEALRILGWQDIPRLSQE